MKFKVALAQISSELGNIKLNIEKMLKYIKLASSKGCNIVIFPELSLTGYYMRDLVYELAETIPGESFNIIKEESVKNNIHTIFGMPEKLNKYSDIIFNSLVWIYPNGEYKVYRKIYLPTYRIFEEQKYFRNGSSPAYVNTEYGNFGLTICFDVFFPELTRYYSIKGCHTVINISASPSPSKRYFETLLQARALENTINVIYVNTVGVYEGINFWGGSCVINARGEILSKAKYFEEDFIVAEINLEELIAAKKNRPILKHLNKDIFKTIYDTLNEINFY
jgi:predicted amidohydrolase